MTGPQPSARERARVLPHTARHTVWAWVDLAYGNDIACAVDVAAPAYRGYAWVRITHPTDPRVALLISVMPGERGRVRQQAELLTAPSGAEALTLARARALITEWGAARNEIALRALAAAGYPVPDGAP
jgi:hypothetical protein